MATGGLNTFRDNAVYIGYGKQAAWGTAIAPTNFWIWRDGSDANPSAKLQVEREGDTSGVPSLAYKTWQGGALKIVEYARPTMVGCALQALLGTASDTYTATINTTLSAQATAGATTVILVGNIGNVGTQAVALEGGYAAPNLEVITLDLTTRTGTGPWTYTLAAAATVQRTHLISTTVTAASHAFSPKYAFDPYTIEVGWNTDGGTVQVERYIDAICYDIEIASGKGGVPVMATHSWYAGTTQRIGTALSGVTLPTGTPFRHSDASGLWQIGGLTTGNAATVEQLKLKMKRSVTAEDFQSEGLNSVFFLPGNLDVDGSLTAIFNTFADRNLAFYGQVTPPANTKDSAAVGATSIQTTYQQDALDSLLLSLPNVTYKGDPLKMSLKGNGIRQPITFTTNKTPALQAFFAATLLNSFMQSY
jgi:hypothetical protein